MSLYAVAFVLRSSDHNYAPLFQKLASAGAQRMWDTTWLLDVNQNVPEVTNALLNFVKEGDSLLLVRIGNESPWSITGTDQETKDWLGRRADLLVSRPCLSQDIRKLDKRTPEAGTEQRQAPVSSRGRKRRLSVVR